MEIIKPRTLSGFMELLPEKQLKFDRMAEVLRKTYASYGFAPLDTSPVRAVAIHPAPAQWCPHTRTEKTRHENPPRIRVNFRAWFIVYDAVI